MVDVTGIEPVTPCLQSEQGKTPNALLGVAYTKTDEVPAPLIIPKLYRELPCGQQAQIFSGEHLLCKPPRPL